MILSRLVYFSRTNPDAGMEIEQILDSARRFNAAHAITGALWFNGEYFIQVLEGDRRAISALFGRIAMDPRHIDIQLASCEAVDARAFAHWRMAYIPDTEANRNLMLKFSAHHRLDPTQMSAASLLQLLIEGEMQAEQAAEGAG